MADTPVSINFVQPKGLDKKIRMTRQWPDRLRKIQPMVAYMGAEYVKDLLQHKIPKGVAGGYTQALEVVKVRGTRKGEYAYSVQIDSRNRKVKQVKVHRSLIYVKPAKRMKRASPLVAILEKNSPWTYETLPFTPKKSDGFLVTRKASARMVRTVAAKNQRILPKLSAAFAKEGFNAPSRSNKMKIGKGATVLPDVALDALKLEFGLGDTKPRPFWRQAFRTLAKQAFQSFIKNKKLLAFPLTRPSFSLWKKFPTKTKHTISIGQARKFKAFQQKVAVRS